MSHQRLDCLTIFQLGNCVNLIYLFQSNMYFTPFRYGLKYLFKTLANNTKYVLLTNIKKIIYSICVYWLALNF